MYDLAKSIVLLCDGQKLHCKNTVNDIKRDLDEKGRVKLKFYYNEVIKKLCVHKNFIITYYSA